MIRLLIKKRKKRGLLGQSTLEYAVLIIVVIMALMGIQAYLKRAIEGRQKEQADSIGSQFSSATSAFNITTKTGATINETSPSVWSTRTRYTDQTSERSGSTSIGNFKDEYWVTQEE